jgi:hypothetical protein
VFQVFGTTFRRRSKITWCQNHKPSMSKKITGNNINK